MEENINERLSELGTKILATTRNELYIHMRFLDAQQQRGKFVKAGGGGNACRMDSADR